MTPHSNFATQNSLLLFVVGPTASGKTRLGIELSTRLGGEIVSMDSMQIYRTLDIGTGKPSRDEQNQARHHLIDIRNADETYSAAQWADDARKAIEEIHSRGKTPIIVGGSGFYARALLQPETLASAPPDEELRARLQNALQQYGAEWLHNELRVLDTVAAERLPVGDTRRVIRAIEVAKSARKSSARKSIDIGQISSFSPHPSAFAGRPAGRPLVFGLEWPRPLLYRRIENRIEQMLRDGFMDELQRLVDLNLPHGATALQSLGYKQMRPVLENANRLDECLELWQRDTRRYAKRQMTWFRHQLPTQWIEVDDADDVTKTADLIAIEYSKAKRS